MRVTLRHGSQTTQLEADPEMRLRDLQKILCVTFQQRFPKMKAAVTLGGETYDDFNDKPFAAGAEVGRMQCERALRLSCMLRMSSTPPHFLPTHSAVISACQVAIVSFTANVDDPFFHDVADRLGMKVSLQEEMLWETEREQGLTQANLKDWIRCRRGHSLDVALQPPWEKEMRARVTFARACYKKLHQAVGQ